MKLKNTLIVVKDITLSKSFYHDIFGLHVITDFGRNVILSEGLVLQEQNLWEEFTGKQVIFHNNATELYFEDNDLEVFAKKLENSGYNIQYVNKLMEHDWGQRVIRIYDPDGHIIEIGEPMDKIKNSNKG
ncbi:MAG: VOC family protein [Thermoflexaceae bacterium]|nr:VOC family protein [Thermoflexaceae bacterium]